MNVDKQALQGVLDSAKNGGTVYYEINNSLKCELKFEGNNIKFIVCLYRNAHKYNQLLTIAQKRHAQPDQFADIKIGTDKSMNVYAGRTLPATTVSDVKESIENVCDFLLH